MPSKREGTVYARDQNRSLSLLAGVSTQRDFSDALIGVDELPCDYSPFLGMIPATARPASKWRKSKTPRPTKDHGRCTSEGGKSGQIESATVHQRSREILYGLPRDGLPQTADAKASHPFSQSRQSAGRHGLLLEHMLPSLCQQEAPISKSSLRRPACGLPSRIRSRPRHNPQPRFVYTAEHGRLFGASDSHPRK